MKCPECGAEFKDPTKVKGGQKSKRTITPEQQETLQEARRKKNQPGNIGEEHGE